jgi:hypothetical protein
MARMPGEREDMDLLTAGGTSSSQGDDVACLTITI